MFCPRCGKDLPNGAQFCDACGTVIPQAQAAPQPPASPYAAYQNPAYPQQQPYAAPYANAPTANGAKQDSYFDGGLLSLIGWSLLGALVTSLTLGICYPWALCMVYGWKINHTVIEGRRLRFTGKAVGLFGLWLKWLLLCVITLGIYGLWLSISLEKWKVKHTEFEN